MDGTIFAPATASGRAGVSVIRISGPKAYTVPELMCGIKNPKPRYAYHSEIKALDGTPIDEGIVLCCPNPSSFTGEDVVELQTHGGRAVMSAVLGQLAKLEGLRPAERGEFTRRAVENGKMDLTSAEGLADLVDAETEQQRRQALRQMGGALAEIYEKWREELKHLLAWEEAYIDFPEEEIPDDVSESIRKKIVNIENEIKQHLDDSRRGERLREGYLIAIVGAPNAGKSSLMNKLAKKDVAIVSSTAGTTRDVIEVKLDLNGYPVIIADTAGLRETDEEIEAEGIRRALAKAEEADLVLQVIDASAPSFEAKGQEKELQNSAKVLKIFNKTDISPITSSQGFAISAKTGNGIAELLEYLSKRVEDTVGLKEEPSLTRLRHRSSLEECVKSLEDSLKAPQTELMAEDLRMAMRSLGKITGQVGVEELLDVIFKDFCIGK